MDIIQIKTKDKIRVITSINNQKIIFDYGI